MRFPLIGGRRQKATPIAAAQLALALVVGACSPVVSPQPATSSPTQSPVAASATPPTLPSNPPRTEPPDPTAVVADDCGSVIAVTEARTSPKQGLAVYATGKGLALYDISNNAITQLDSSSSPNGPGPRFRTPAQVSFVRLREEPDEAHTFGQDSLVEFDVTQRDATEILRFPNSILAYEWNADGTVLAYLLRTQTPTLVGPHLLCSFDSRAGKTSFLRRIENPFGTSVGQREETAVTWSPNGQHLLVTDTAARPSLFIVTRDGRDAVTPQNGTFGRWMADGQVLFQQDPQDAAAPWEWLLLSAATGATRPYGLPSTAFRPAKSPSGELIAFDDGDRDEPAVHLFDTETRTATRLADGYVAPIWIGSNLIAATAVGRCTSSEFCDVPWVPTGETTRINTATAKRQALTLPSTLAGVVRYGVIDVLLP